MEQMWGEQIVKLRPEDAVRGQLFNDGNYEYNEVGLPFLAELGRALYDFELARNRMFTPDLGALVAGHRL